MAKRGNPLDSPIGRKVLSQNVANPVANAENVTSNSAKLRVPAAKSKTLNQNVKNPVAMRKMNKTGANGAC